MCARRSTDTRRHPKQPQPPAAAAVPEPGASGSLVQNPVQATPDPAGVELDMGASDVIDQRARRRAL
ncbi:MAG TPA: hypothetical protein PK095_22915, partial [Myxococcota bacterium]|nr:hypothetical protein [Myxococcota bacterium]